MPSQDDTRAVIGAPEAVPGQAVMAVRQHLINEGCTIPIDVIRAALAKIALDVPDQVVRLHGQPHLIAELRAQKDAAYAERDQLVAALSKQYPAHLVRHPEADEWDSDWRWIVCVHLPTGQVTWHIHDSELPLFGHLNAHTAQANHWDGHSTQEKYERLARLQPVVRPFDAT